MNTLLAVIMLLGAHVSWSIRVIFLRYRRRLLYLITHIQH